MHGFGAAEATKPPDDGRGQSLSEAWQETIEQHLGPTLKGERRYAGLRPKDAATLIIIDREGTLPKVLMGRRHPGHTSCRANSCFRAGASSLGDRACPRRARFTRAPRPRSRRA